MNHYDSLRDQIEGLLTEGRQFGRRAAEWEKVETYWGIGDALTAYLDSMGGTTQGEQTIHNLSKDCKLSASLLYEILRFRRRLPVLHARVNLGWSHYRALIFLPDNQLAHYEHLAEEGAWTTRQLKLAIEADTDVAPQVSDAPVPALRARFGEPYTYRVVEDPVTGEPALDLGFHQVWLPGRDLPDFGLRVKIGDRVTLDPVEPQIHVRTDTPRLWTYVVEEWRIIDGDTLDAVVDLGFGHRAFPRLRLRGVDTPELYTRAGQAAREFVVTELANCEILVVATRRTDTYGRYLADVKWMPGTAEPGQVIAEGIFLNTELLKRRLATPYR